MTYETKDSGERVLFESGFTRDNADAKPRYDLIPLELLQRLAELYTRGAEKYGESNWKLATGEKEIHRFKECAWRHFVKWQAGLEDGEDHSTATIWNVIAYEWHTKHKDGDIIQE